MSLIVSLAAFLDPAALAIVGGGTVLATVLRTPARDLARGVVALKAIGRTPFDAGPLVTQVEALSRITARHGVLQLDRSVIKDPDVSAAMNAIVDGADGAIVRTLIEDRRVARYERQRAAAEMWAAAAEFGPAMGMVGTLIGLVRLFTSMTDPAAIGGAMAIAVLATLYGALVGNLICLPVAARLKRLARAECVERGRLAEPLARLATREAPCLRPVAVA
ncbi:MotA/TolQ/ExbB proton channel family protein [uncultured Sphingomonas sp.]|uniref:MotA/TolQ/ExbB proton channel family protein n=1 Tax=uncultured Sphingomonas sp. TaxID=158754 RepID=UPI0025DC418E|nr:MotA/TolQ/ExbB proton channel family protein [uncultured Sphingomonas sp.]